MKRYHIERCGVEDGHYRCNADMVESDDGNYVLHNDAVAELARLTAEVARLTSVIETHRSNAETMGLHVTVVERERDKEVPR